jgi:hypothetical protein
MVINRKNETSGRKRDTIVFLYKFPMSKVYADVLNFDLFLSAGYNLILLDMSRIFYPNVYKNYYSGRDEYIVKRDWFIECSTKKKAISWIKKYADNSWFYVLHHSYVRGIDEWWLFSVLKRYKCHYLLAEILNVPERNNQQVYSVNHYLKVFQVLGRFELIRFVRGISSRIFIYLLGLDFLVRTPAFCFGSGSISLNMFRRLYPKSEVISIPNINYRKYYITVLQGDQSRNDKVPKYKYILYIDQSVFDSPDHNLLGLNTIDKDIFFKKINDFFECIEDVTGKKVVISGSPKYSYKGHEYGGREIIYNKTPELTYHSEMTIAHSTSAIDYAILAYKPLVLLKIDGFSDNIIQDIQRYAQALQKTALSSNEVLDPAKVDLFSRVDRDMYDRYISNYLTTESFSCSFVDVIINKFGESN